MARIRLLSEKVANQIAAGEVIDRPSSIVKELVENAIDASATRIEIDVEAGGRSLIRVIDNGIGMSRDDALLSLERHATSKISRASDLDSVETMGFRGEALPSISSVSRFTITTKERENEDAEGTRIVVCGGNLLDVCAANGATGTTIEVRNVFFNLPARRKFLRSAKTERAHIQHYLQLVALAHPKIRFAYKQDGRRLWQVPAAQSSLSDLSLLVQRFKALQQDESQMLRLEEEGFAVGTKDEQEPISLWGLIGAPGISRSNRLDQHLFVNRRPIENRGLHRALIEGYHSSLMKGRFPRCCLFLEIAPHFVDVNVHPAKREVKFRNEFAVRRFVAETIKKRLLHFAPKVFSKSYSPPPDPNSDQKSSHNLNQNSDQNSNRNLNQNLNHNSDQNSDCDSDQNSNRDLRIHSAQSASEKGEGRALLDLSLKWIGVLKRLYVIYESDRGMVLMDQHAAHERVLFEHMMRQLESGNAPSQRLLLPEMLELSPRDSAFLREQLGSLLRIGVSLSEFGDRSFLLDALPPFAKVPDAKQFTLELIDQLKCLGQSIGTIRLGEEGIAKTVCRHAVKANDKLHPLELERLLEDLRACELPYTCPHGRPTLIELDCQELEKRFGRLQ